MDYYKEKLRQELHKFDTEQRIINLSQQELCLEIEKLTQQTADQQKEIERLKKVPQIQYQEVLLSDVIEYYKKNFILDDSTIIDIDNFIYKDKVIFKFYLERR